MNHLSHFLLTLELLPVLLESAGQTGDGRIVIVSSRTYSWSNWEPDNMNGEREYSRTGFYYKSKLYNVCTYNVISWSILLLHMSTDNDRLCTAKTTSGCGYHCVNPPPWLGKLHLHTLLKYATAFYVAGIYSPFRSRQTLLVILLIQHSCTYSILQLAGVGFSQCFLHVLVIISHHSSCP